MTHAPACAEQVPHPHATKDEVDAAFDDPKRANVLYHDWEAESYDEKWSISYDERCLSYAVDVFRIAAGEEDSAYPSAMELGSGTGFFLLNLMQGGIIKRGSVTDLAPGMVRAALRNACHLGLDVDGRVADAEYLPYPDDSFDLIIGHAVLHHIPDVDAAFAEVLRVLKPGGRFVFAGEPTRIGDRYARKFGQLSRWLATNIARLPGLRGWRRPQYELDDSSRAAALAGFVDIHTFDPSRLERSALRAGAVDVHAVTEEFAAALVGRPVRTLEAGVDEEKISPRWQWYAYKAWFNALSLDRKVFAKVLPRELLCNVMLSGLSPDEPVTV